MDANQDRTSVGSTNSRESDRDGLETQAHRPSTRGELEVRCPNCHASMDVAVDTHFTDLTCASCGSHFSLVDQSQATRMAPPLSKMGRFELIERLGVGSFGSVWKARDKELDRTVAIKIPRQGGMSAEEQEKFFREARAAAQLRHPSIVSVHEVGRDGDSVYIVSDFVRGVTLGDWLTGQQLTNREAAELCAKVAGALDHAHEHGIVHRDLKPANIIMDGDGEPHLMDFGLARRDAGEVTVTMDGQVVGTPAYMSPEQAEGRGHDADRRSDVYSLGVILFQLLTGELPFRGNARMLMHQVINDEPPSPRKLNANVAKDLETITLKCLEKDPSRRYQSAADMAAELKRYRAGEPILARPLGGFERTWRWVKRNRRVAALTASVAVLLVTIAALSLVGFAVAKKQQLAAQQAADREAKLRGQAEVNLALAEEAVDHYLTRVAEDERLKQGDFNKLRTELLESAVPFYEQFAKQKPDDAKSEANQANAYARLASIHGETGQHQRSVSEYEQAIALQDDLVSQYPNNPQYKRDLANHHAELGWNFHVIIKAAEARPHYDAALAILEKLAQEFPNEPKYRQMLARTHERYGMLVRYADATAGQKQFEHAIEIQRSLVDEFPKVSDYKVGLASSSFYLGHLLRKTQPKTAKTYLMQAVDIQRMLSGEHPKNPEYRSALAESLTQLGWVLNTLGDTADSRQYLDEGMKLQDQVVAQFPSVVKYRVIRGNIAFNYGETLSGAGDSAGAVRCFAQYVDIYEKLSADFPDVPYYSQFANTGRFSWINALEKSGDMDEAEQQRKLALERAAKLVAEFPNEPAYRTQLVEIHERLIQRLLQRNEPAAAREHYEQVVAICAKMVEDFPETNAFRQQLCDQHERLATLQLRLNDTSAARQSLEQALAIRTKMLEELPNSPEHKDDRAKALNALARQLATSSIKEIRNAKQAVEYATTACELNEYQNSAYVDTLVAAHASLGDQAATRQQYEKLLPILAKSAEDSPKEHKRRAALGKLHVKFAEWLTEQKDLAAAQTHREQALAICDQLAADFPGEAGYRADATWQNVRLAILLDMRNDIDAAHARYEKSVPMFEELFRVNPTVRNYGDWIAWLHRKLAAMGEDRKDSAAARAHYEQALATTEKLAADFPDQPDYRSQAANEHLSLGMFLMQQGERSAAIGHFYRTLDRRKKLADDSPDQRSYRASVGAFQNWLGRMLEEDEDWTAARKLYEDSAATFEGLLTDDPVDEQERASIAGTLNDTAWRLATSTSDKLRNGKRAVEIATKACELEQFRSADHLDTLAAAYAETGDFDAAVKWSEKSIDLLDLAVIMDSQSVLGFINNQLLPSVEKARLRKSFNLAIVNYKNKRPTRVVAGQNLVDVVDSSQEGDVPQSPGTQETAPASDPADTNAASVNAGETSQD